MFDRLVRIDRSCKGSPTKSKRKISVGHPAGVGEVLRTKIVYRSGETRAIG